MRFTIKHKILAFLFLLILVSACGAEIPPDFEDIEEFTPEIEEVEETEESTPFVSETSSDAETWLMEFEQYLQEKMEDDHIPGMAVALVNSDEIIYTQGFGFRNVEENLPVTPDTLFHIGSTQKSMTAMLIATLVDDGYFDWDTPVVEILPEFVLSDPEATQEVTFRHLLSMRAGISEEAEDEIDTGGSFDDLLDAVAETEIVGFPGEVFEYSNLSVSLAGYLGSLAVDEDTEDFHTAYAELLKERILLPIGMNTATLYLSEAQSSGNFSYSYALDGDEPVLTETYDVEKDILAPSGSLKASVTEMGLYIQTQLNRGLAPNGTRVVSEENLTETWQPYLEDYGMGWEIKTHEGIKIISHEGAYDDFVSIIGFMPDENIGFVVLVNSEETGAIVEEVPFVLAELLAK